ncbi:MAG: Hsp20/alpha crystallin family protein [bacterium]|nr:Hsp20/alpha crystallin family protein [bacterium]MDY4098797.1 Hsp20/alpha crystallin family protein [Lachnospiraceae bacterium]
MMMHDIFGEDLFDDFMDDFAFPAFPDTEKALYGKHAKNLMKTDVKETDTEYELIIDLPGFKKEDVKASLENGYLTIQASKGLDKDEQEKKSGKYIRRERYAGTCARSFYVGDDITQDEIKGNFKHGILRLTIPKKDAKPAVEQTNYIAIEG